MNYELVYKNLVLTRINRGLKEGEYYERHHIKPECIGGDNGIDNLVTLTAREHYLAHWLLVKIYPHEWRLRFAFYQMSKTNGKNRRVISSRQFERAKFHMAEGARMRAASGYNPGRSEASRKKASARMNSDQNPLRGKPEKNPTARPHRVVFDDGTEKVYQYGKQGYEELGIPRSTWILAVRTGSKLPKHKVHKITKE